MIKAKLTAVAVVGIALAGLGGSVAIGPAPVAAAEQNLTRQCDAVVKPALDHSNAAMALGNTLDAPGVNYGVQCSAMKKHEAILADDARNLTVCDGAKLGSEDRVALEGLLNELKASRASITRSRIAVCEAAG